MNIYYVFSSALEKEWLVRANSKSEAITDVLFKNIDALYSEDDVGIDLNIKSIGQGPIIDLTELKNQP